MKHSGKIKSKEIISIALSKGRLFEEVLKLFKNVNIELIDSKIGSRKFVLQDREKNFQFFLLKPVDVPTYVEYGVADVGIAGRDVLLESKADIHLPLDLKIGRCSMVVAGISGTAKEDYRELSAVRIATKYPRITTEYFTQRGVPVEIIYLSGSVELAPVLGLAERIVDLVSTGQTLADNGLQIIEKICDISACLVVNRASYQIKHRAITGLIELLEKSSPSIKS